MIFGAVIDDTMKDEVQVTVIATGFGAVRAAAGSRRRSRPRRHGPSTPRAVAPRDEIDIPSFLKED